ncbi:phage tail tape measure protein [Methanobrevibacter smithii]|uniref:phage tail tape measure protein n=1 Tax=Methanobrevibacter smithii TaxID=2173 RepID=UPI0037DCF50C
MAFTSGSPGSSLEIGIALVLQDRFSNQAREASNTIRKLHNDAKMAVDANLNAGIGVANTMTSIADNAFSVLSASVVAGAEFIDTMTTVGAITQATESQMRELRDIAQTLGLESMFNSQEIASGMKYLAMAGNDFNEVTQMIRGAVMVAGASGMEIGGKGGAADIITNVMRTFRQEGERASVVVGDQMTKAALSANISMIDLAESIKYAGADMVTLNQTLPQTMAMIGTLGNAGIQASMAGTAISNMARYLNKSIADPNFKGGKALASIGLSPEDFLDTTGSIIDLGDALEKIKIATQDMNASQRNLIMNQIFGVRGMRAAVAMMNDLEGYRELLNKIQNESSGTASEMMDKRMSSLAGRLDAMVNSFENLATTFATSVTPVLGPIFDAVGYVMGILRNILATPVLGTFIAGFTTLGVLAGVVFPRIIKFWASIKLLRNDSQISMANFFAILRGGWRGAAMDATRYMAIEKALIKQRRGGIAADGVLASAQAALSGGAVVAGVSKTRNGRYRDETTSRFIKKTEAQRRLSSATSADIERALTGRPKPNISSTAGRIGKGILSMGKGLLGFLGGPWGFAIITIASLIPSLIGAIRGNKEETTRNTEATSNLTKRYDSLKTEAEAARLTKQNNQPTTQDLIDAIRFWATMLDKNNGKPINITLNVDGKKAIQETIDNNQEDINLNTGIK